MCPEYTQTDRRTGPKTLPRPLTREVMKGAQDAHVQRMDHAIGEYLPIHSGKETLTYNLDLQTWPRYPSTWLTHRMSVRLGVRVVTDSQTDRHRRCQNYYNGHKNKSLFCVGWPAVCSRKLKEEEGGRAERRVDSTLEAKHPRGSPHCRKPAPIYRAWTPKWRPITGPSNLVSGIQHD